jgi:nucleoside phosphorylase
MQISLSTLWSSVFIGMGTLQSSCVKEAIRAGCGDFVAEYSAIIFSGIAGGLASAYTMGQYLDAQEANARLQLAQNLFGDSLNKHLPQKYA